MPGEQEVIDHAWAEENPRWRPTSEDDPLVCWTFVGLAWRLVQRPELGSDAGPIWPAVSFFKGAGMGLHLSSKLGLLMGLNGLGP